MRAELARGVLATLLALVWLAAPAQAADPKLVAEQEVRPRVFELTIETDAFAAPTKLHVLLPTGYDADRARRWPVTYFMAGTMNSYSTFVQLLPGEELTRSYPSIVVAPDAKSGYWSDWYNGGALGPPKYETFVIEQLIPLIDAHFRTDPDRRAIFGISMGGYGAMMLAARHPDRFVAAASLSGAVDSNLPYLSAALSLSSTFDGAPVDAIYGPRASQEVRWRGHNPADLADNLRGMDLQVRTANGTLNPAIGEQLLSADFLSCVVEAGVYAGSVSLHETLGRLGIEHAWRDYGAGCHSLPNFTREVRDTLAVFERVLARRPAAWTAFEFASIEPRFDVWGWRVEADPARALEGLRLRAGRAGFTLVGSGRTTVTTPAWYRGLRAVDVDGTPVTPGADGRVRIAVDLGAPHRVQQYRRGASGTFVTREVALAPHARACGSAA